MSNTVVKDFLGAPLDFQRLFEAAPGLFLVLLPTIRRLPLSESVTPMPRRR